ncbi:hypothetical protein F2P81_009543 [Scophthalmus maximus]|uniref:Neurexin-2-like n=1 Tax=Scophthalmus maximus TaxID=52904 RepID=A0A6A4T239_SCOMX|nr:hypothetical protein F2P81_009543 [Scophthalmus maximus]
MTRGLRFLCWPLWPLALLSLLSRVKTLEFGGAPGQWARYGRWEAGSVGELSFSLKTNISKALVLYLDDGGNCDFLELLIAGGRLQMRFAIHCAEPATLHMETRVNDDRWHMVLLTRNFRETLLMVDGETKVAEVKSKRKEMAVVSDLFVGGIPPDVRLSALTSSTVKYEPPFQGLISNLKVGEMPPTLLNSQGIQSDLEYLCTKQNPCFNGGFCSIQYGEVHCDCTHTRFKGKYCKEEMLYAYEYKALDEDAGQRKADSTERKEKSLNSGSKLSGRQLTVGDITEVDLPRLIEPNFYVLLGTDQINRTALSRLVQVALRDPLTLLFDLSLTLILPFEDKRRSCADQEQVLIVDNFKNLLILQYLPDVNTIAYSLAHLTLNDQANRPTLT